MLGCFWVQEGTSICFGFIWMVLAIKNKVKSPKNKAFISQEGRVSLFPTGKNPIREQRASDLNPELVFAHRGT